MHRYASDLSWINQQRERMCRLIADWANVNTGSHNLAGLDACAGRVEAELACLGGYSVRVDLPAYQTVDAAGQVTHRQLGRALRIWKRPDAPLHVLLAIHLDTVFAAEHPFQSVTMPSANVMQGPGVADAKGGVAVLLVALEALERSQWAQAIGWEIVLNPDEELGSPGSGALLASAAQRNDLGLLFEPALPDGTLVGARKGSGNFTAVVRGRSAHAGRDPHLGRNAIHALARFVGAISSLDGTEPGLTVNVGKIEGGTAANVVPDMAIARLNVRAATQEQMQLVERRLRELAAEANQSDGINLQIHGGFLSPPKPLEGRGLALMEHVASCGRDLALEITWRSSGGVCDGNKLADAGLPNVDSLGVRGGGLHSSSEYLLIDSLTERAQLAALLLMKLASGEIAWPRMAPSRAEVAS
jgi:glutamate carboxypeptidase